MDVLVFYNVFFTIKVVLTGPGVNGSGLELFSLCLID